MNSALTDVPGLRVGHWSDHASGTGCSVVLTPEGACGGVDVRGSAPGTRETALLDPVGRVDRVHAVLLSGGSAFGLGAAHGVVRWLAERGFGWPTPAAPVPIVPAAILYDLGFAGSTAYPTDENAYAACEAATHQDSSRGSVGAGVGCTVGKLRGPALACRGGLGQASAALPGGVIVAALVAVNAVGDVMDPRRGELVAGARDPDTGQLVDSLSEAAARFDSYLFRPPASRDGGEASVEATEAGLAASRPAEDNTTIGVIATNLALSKPQVTKLAQMGQTGVSRTTRPAHTVYDGDCIFALATGALEAAVELSLLGAVAAEVVADAVLDGVRNATTAHGLPSAASLAPKPLA
ncbi:MAG: P1 family peptidase [Caldilineaceae bacterium]|nr:P1 family peptidase [Caldilineaceae bacterium]